MYYVFFMASMRYIVAQALNRPYIYAYRFELLGKFVRNIRDIEASFSNPRITNRQNFYCLHFELYALKAKKDNDE